MGQTIDLPSIHWMLALLEASYLWPDALLNAIPTLDSNVSGLCIIVQIDIPNLNLFKLIIIY